MKEKLEIAKLKGELFIGKIKILFFILIVLLEIYVISQFLLKNNILESEPAGPKIAVVNFNQEVTDAYVNKVMIDIDTALENKDYKEILFIMNSPGGSPTASEELSEYLKEITKKTKVTMYIQSIAASGGYYIASSIKPLVSNKNAIVGSIGVIMPHYNFGELAEKIGIEEDFLAAGKYKKPISMLKKIDKDNKAYLTKQVLSPMYENFLKSVATNRGLGVDKLRPFAEGKIYIANSKEIKNVLIDEISTLYFVKKEMKKKYKKISFHSVIKKDPNSLFGPKVKLDLNVKGLLNNTIGEIQ